MEVGPGCRRFGVDDRVIVYHISGCGVCNDCRRGYMISCTSEKYRRAYGWQRDGGMADYMIAEEKDLIALPDQLSFADGAQVACGFGTVYEAVEKVGINGNHSVLITGLGPVGLAAAALCRKLGAQMIVGIDIVPERLRLAESLKLCDVVLTAGQDNVVQLKELTRGFGVERAFDCSADARARATAIRATRKWGRIAFVGEGGTVEFNPSPDIIHDQKTIYGSWVTSTWLMEDLVERLVRWNLHPADIITHRFALEDDDLGEWIELSYFVYVSFASLDGSSPSGTDRLLKSLDAILDQSNKYWTEAASRIHCANTVFCVLRLASPSERRDLGNGQSVSRCRLPNRRLVPCPS